MRSKNLPLDSECQIWYSEKMMSEKFTKKWSEDDKLTVYNMRKSGFSYEEIAQELNTTKGAVSQLIARMKASGYTDILTINKWSEDDELELIRLREQGLKNTDIANKLNKSIDSVKKKCSEFIKLGLIERQAQGGQSSGFDKDKLTTLYLLYFKEENMYKIGITQRTIALRFAGSPEYTIVDRLESSVDECLELESILLSSMFKFKYMPVNPWFDRNGKTECFKLPVTVGSLEELFDL